MIKFELKPEEASSPTTHLAWRLCVVSIIFLLVIIHSLYQIDSFKFWMFGGIHRCRVTMLVDLYGSYWLGYHHCQTTIIDVLFLIFGFFVSCILTQKIKGLKSLYLLIPWVLYICVVFSWLHDFLFDPSFFPNNPYFRECLRVFLKTISITCLSLGLAGGVFRK